MKKLFLVIVGIFFLTGNCWAQDGYDIGEVVVTPTKTEEQADEIGSSFSVVTSETIERTGRRMVSEVLRDVPGVTVVQSGSIGGLVNVYLRGAKPGATLVLIDGVTVNDPMDPDRGFNFANLTTEDIERIEIVRGPQSTLYGSDAMAGVINIITKKGKGKPTVSASVEGGSYTTFREYAGLSGSYERADYALSVTRIDSDGFSMAEGGSEDDGYYNTTLSARGGVNLFESSRLGAVLRYTDAHTDMDDGAFIDDPNYSGNWRDLVSRVEFDQHLLEWWDYNLSCSYSDIKRTYRDKPNSTNDFEDIDSWYKGNDLEAEWQNNFYIKDIDTVTAGIEYERQRGSSYYEYGTFVDNFSRQEMDIWGFYLQNLLELWERLFTTVGIRADDNDEFGTDTNYRAACSYLHKETDTQIKGSFGTGFNAPTLFQLYSIYGDRNLKAEENTGYDFGIVQRLFADKFSVGVTYFHNKFKDMIDWEPALSRYQNIGRVLTKGIEAEASFYPIDTLDIGINYTYTEAEDETTGLELLRRPKNKICLNVNWQFIEKLNLNLNLRYIGKRKDMDFANFSRITLNDYVRVDLACYYNINDKFRVFGRVENLFNEDYEEVYGFNTPGISAYAGARIKL